MTQIYKLISLGEHLYMVDEKADIQEGDTYVLGNITAHNHVIHKAIGEMLTFGKEMQRIFRTTKNPIPEQVKCMKIIASTDKSLGLPLLPKVEEDIENLAKEDYYKYNLSPYHDGVKRDYINTFIRGYKAASVKKYTEEDMRRAILKAWDNSEDTKNIDDIIQSLTPKPKQVEVECIAIPKDANGNTIGTGREYPFEGLLSLRKIEYIPKTKDNYMVVKRWIYET